MRFKGAAIALCMGIILLAGGALAQETNLLALGEGTLPVVEPASYGNWRPVNMLDDSPRSAWCSAAGNPGNNVFVFEMLEPATIGAFEFDCTVDGKGRGAKNITVEVSAGSRDAGFETVLQASLVEGSAGQRFAVARKVTGRWVRLTVAGNHGDVKYSELSGFRGYGLKPDASAAAETPITGTFSTSYSEFHLRQQGTAISGCYGKSKGLFEGTIEGRLAKITWSENDGSKRGPAVFVFSPEGETFQGYWWRDSD
ncbi:MAG: discoidin domain-containing protein, partial [Thermoanaerobaculia bacterium]